MNDNERPMIEAIVADILSASDMYGHEIHSDVLGIADSFREDVAQGLHKRITDLLTPSLGEMFLEYLNDIDVLDSYIEDSGSEEIDQHREGFRRKVTASDNSYLIEKLPSVTEMIRNTSSLYYQAVDEMVERIELCHDDICRELLYDGSFTALTGIEPNSGDIHNHGRAAMIVTTDGGKVVYKPHDVRIDLKSKELIELYFGDVMKAPRVCSYDGYGFVEFIANDPATDDETARRYFYSLGGFSAFVQMMGSADLHHSNVLTRGTFPVIIDYELMMTPSSWSIGKGLGQELQFSLLKSSLMPSFKGDSELSILFAVDEGNKGAPVVGGVRKCINDYPYEFFRGFEDIYKRCLENRDGLKDFVKSMEGIYVRHIYRGTKIYAELIRNLRKPAWIRDTNVRDELFGKLSIAMQRSGADNADAITNAEVDALLRGDIPYIYTRTDTLDLYSDGEVVYEGMFRVSPIDNVLARIDHLSMEDMAFEEALLRKAMTRVIRRCPHDIKNDSVISETREISDERLLKSAEKIFTDIADDAVYTPSGAACWFGPNYFLETGMNLLSPGLIDGTLGLALFASAIYKVSSDDDIRQRALDITKTITGRLSDHIDHLLEIPVIYPNIENVSLTSGLAGKLLGCYLIGKFTGDESYHDMCVKMVSLIDKMELKFERIDIYSGLAGLVKVLSRFDDLYSIEGVPAMCARLSDRIVAQATIPFGDKLIWRTLSPNWAISGAGHGQSGVASALFMAGKRLGREDLVEAAMAGFKFESSIYSPKLGAWPDRRMGEAGENYLTGYCSGAPGIGINAIRLRYDDPDDTVGRALASTLKEPLMHKDFLCCGNSSAIDFLLEAGVAMDREDLIAQARTRMALVIDRAEKNGHYNCVNDGIGEVFSPSLYYGVAGIGYEMLRLIYPGDIDSVLL